MSNDAMTGFTPIWEGLITDGSFQPIELLKQANKDMDTKWKVSKPRPKYICKLKPINGTVALQFTDPTGERERSPKGIGCKLTNDGVLEAAEKANLVTQAIQTGTFNWDWFESDIQGKTLTTKEKEKLKEEKEKEEESKSVGELFEAFKKQYFEEDARSNNPKKNAKSSWYHEYRHIDKTFLSKENYDKKLNTALVIECINKTKKDSDTRKRHIASLQHFLEYIDKWDEYSKLIEKYKKNNRPMKRKRSVPSDEEIEHIFKSGFVPTKKTKFSRNLAASWKFVYGLLAVYGLRVHEVWNIANWDKPVILDDKDWVEIEEFTNNIEDIDNENIKSEKIQLKGKTIIPAILDPNNKNKVLAIKHQTKTGHRLAAPLSPIGRDWFKQFGLNQPWNTPSIKDPLGKPGEEGQGYNCSNRACRWFRERKYGFTPHSLRYAWNHTGHAQGIPIGALAESLGHSIQMNTTTYYSAMSIDKKHKVISPIWDKTKNKQSENEKLKEENQKLKEEVIQLKTAIQYKDEEIERLRTELKMIKVIES